MATKEGASETNSTLLEQEKLRLGRELGRQAAALLDTSFASPPDRRLEMKIKNDQGQVVEIGIEKSGPIIYLGSTTHIKSDDEMSDGKIYIAIICGMGKVIAFDRQPVSVETLTTHLEFLQRAKMSLQPPDTSNNLTKEVY